MFSFFSNVDSIIVDATFIAILLLFAFIGILKGFRKTFISTLFFAVSLYLAFSATMSDVKKLLLEKFLKVDEWLPAGSDSATVFLANMLSPFLASLALFALIYFALELVVLALSCLTKKSRSSKCKNKFGRFLAGIMSLAAGGAFLVSLVMASNNNIIGMKTMVSKSEMIGLVVNKVEEVVNKDDKQQILKLTLKLYKGDIMSDVSDEELESFKYLDGKVSKFLNDGYNKKIKDESLVNQQIKVIMTEQVRTLYHLSILSNGFDEYNEAVKEKFSKMSEIWIGAMNSKSLENRLGALDISVEEYGNMKVKLSEAGLDETVIKYLDSVVLAVKQK